MSLVSNNGRDFFLSYYLLIGFPLNVPEIVADKIQCNRYAGFEA